MEIVVTEKLSRLEPEYTRELQYAEQAKVFRRRVYDLKIPSLAGAFAVEADDEVDALGIDER